MIYEPAEDSFLLESIISKYANNKVVLDVGTGSGILADKAKKSGAKSVLATDTNKEAVASVKSRNIKSIQSNLFQKVVGKFDLIICNPPYLPEDKMEDKESKTITTGGKKGDEFILKFLNQSMQSLNLSHKVIASKKLFFEKLEIWEIKEKR